MNIVYGVSGEGLGHIREAIEIVPILQREGHCVKVLTYGDRALELLAPFNPTRIEGLPLYFTEKGLSLTKTLTKNAHCIPFYFKNWRRLRREVAGFRPDACLTAYEPFTTLVAHVLGKPLISMDNQNELLHVCPPDGDETFALKLARLATRICTHGADHYIIKSFSRIEHGKENVHFVSPILQQEIRGLRPTVGEHVLVYLTKPNPGLIEMLKSIDEKFVVYCHDQLGEEGNISFRAQGSGFIEDLSACKAIIATTGLSLIADAIYLKKPYFGVPLRKQFEQTYNAIHLRKSGIGDFSEAVSRDDLESFFRNLPAYRDRLAQYHFDPAEQEETLLMLLDKIGSPSERPLVGLTGTCP